jgi:hypothetical protein
MPEEIQTTVKVPLSEIVASLRRKHELPSKLTGVKIEGNNVVLNFREGGQEPIEVWKSNEPKKRTEIAENVNAMDENPMESVEPMSEEPMETVEPMNEEEPVENEEAMQTAEVMNEEESMEDEKARERKRFWRK